MKTKELARIALIAAVYAVVTLILAPISFNVVQIRVSEALTLLPFFMGYPAVIGLFVGVVVANFFGGLGVVDIVFGSLITLVAAYFTSRSRSLYTAGIYPVVFNALGIGLMLYFLMDIRLISLTAEEIMFLARDISGFLEGFLNYLLHALSVGAGQFIAVYIIGIPLMKLLNKKVDLENF